MFVPSAFTAVGVDHPSCPVARAVDMIANFALSSQIAHARRRVGRSCGENKQQKRQVNK
jgi:hypothetical protein